MAKKVLHPIDKEIIRALMNSRIRVTPSKISKAINVHPSTAQRRIMELSKNKIISCKKSGNRTYCDPLRINELKKKLKRDFLFG